MRRAPASGARARLALLACLLLSSACRLGSGYVASPQPPDLGVVPPEKIASSMWVLAAEARRIDELLAIAPEGGGGTFQKAIRGSLERMAVAASQLDTAGRSTPRHPVLSQNLAEFRERIERAQRAVERDPPNYFPASVVSSGCFLCHGSQRAGLRQSASFGASRVARAPDR